MSGVVDFQPIPKRFMVWDKIDKKFLDDPSQVCAITPLGGLITRPDMIIVQSTNLFDKDGKEIFEGSILKEKIFEHNNKPVYAQWIVRGDKEGTYFEKHRIKGARFGDMLLGDEEDTEVIGHILSNPELLEGDR